jgi:hypothetical protein
MDDGIAVDVADGGHDALLQFLLGGDADVAEHGSRQLREEAFGMRRVALSRANT